MTEEAEKLAMDFLKSNGYYRVRQTGYIKSGNSLEFAFAYCMSDYLLYTDQIKVKVALDNGEIIGFDATSYLTNHDSERKLPETEIAVDDAKSKLNNNLDVKTVQKCLIPLDTGEDVYCYEFSGFYNNRQFLVYINIEDGSEEDVLIVADENGSRLTM